jgi:pimeloyl-ACP methyl ester carboxylesterase
METAWNHQFVEANGIRIHYVRHGAGFPLILLHGWPGFWYVWRKNILPLAEHFDVIVPDQRGFGDTDKPDVPAAEGYNKYVRAEDLLGFVYALGLDRFGIVTHDIGSWVAQVFVIKNPERVPRLFLFDCPYPGIGDRWSHPDHLKEIWYMWFNQQPWAPKMIGSSRENTRLYLSHILSHWAHDPHAFDEDLEAWVDTISSPETSREASTGI